MIPKKKICAGCGLESFIWKRVEGKPYCKQCSCNAGVAKPSNTKPTARKNMIPPRSQKRSKEERLYSAKRIIFLQEHPMCQAHLPGICTKHSQEVHHRKGRIADNLLDETHWLALCHMCHDYIENNRQFAMEKGFSIKRIT